MRHKYVQRQRDVRTAPTRLSTILDNCMTRIKATKNQGILPIVACYGRKATTHKEFSLNG